MRASPDAVLEAASAPDAVLLPLTGGKVWVMRLPKPTTHGARWVPAEARLSALVGGSAGGADGGAAAGHWLTSKMSFMGFRHSDGAPVFAADVGRLAPDRVAEVRRAVVSNPAMCRLHPPSSREDLETRVEVRDAKSVGPEMERNDAGLAAAAAGLIKWQNNVNFCQKCGSPVTLVKAGHKAVCTNADCKAPFYPVLMPAVLTLCTCGDYALLGRNSKWPRGFYSCLAGFVDQSESLEQAVAREVLEESGIAITPGSAKYHSSQPWPFPCQLMVGFRAEVTERRSTGAFGLPVPPMPKMDIGELRDARWFHRDWLREQLGKHVDPRENPHTGEIPVGEIALPGSHALARYLVEEWVAEGVTKERALASRAAAVALEGGEAAPTCPPTNRSFAFIVVELKGRGGGKSTILRMQQTGGGGAPTANDHARLAAGTAREATRLGAEATVLGGGQLCFRGGEVSESAESTDENEARLVVIIRNGGGGDAGGQVVERVDVELVVALLRRAYPMHDVLTPGAEGSGASNRYQY